MIKLASRGSPWPLKNTFGGPERWLNRWSDNLNIIFIAHMGKQRTIWHHQLYSICVYVPSLEYSPISWCINGWVITEINQCKENRSHKYYFTMYMFSKGPIFRHKTKPCFFIYTLENVYFFIINISYPNEQTLGFNRQQEGNVDPRESWKPLAALVTSKGEAQLQLRPLPPS